MNEKVLDAKELENVSGGRIRENGTYTYTKGTKIYTNIMRNWYYGVNEDYNKVSANTSISVTQYTYPSGYRQGDKTITAEKLYECVMRCGLVQD